MLAHRLIYYRGKPYALRGNLDADAADEVVVVVGGRAAVLNYQSNKLALGSWIDVGGTNVRMTIGNFDADMQDELSVVKYRRSVEGNKTFQVLNYWTYGLSSNTGLQLVWQGSAHTLLLSSGKTNNTTILKLCGVAATEHGRGILHRSGRTFDGHGQRARSPPYRRRHAARCAGNKPSANLILIRHR